MNNETATATQTLPSGELMLLFNPSQYRLTNYQAAMKELCARLDILNNDFKYCTGRSPIHHVESRWFLIQVGIIKTTLKYRVRCHAVEAKNRRTYVCFELKNK